MRPEEAKVMEMLEEDIMKKTGSRKRHQRL